MCCSFVVSTVAHSVSHQLFFVSSHTNFAELERNESSRYFKHRSRGRKQHSLAIDIPAKIIGLMLVNVLQNVIAY